MRDDFFTPWRPAWTLRDDGALLVVDKPTGISTHGADEGRSDDVVSRLRAHWRRVSPARDPYLGIHQRLDRDTSGVLVFATDRAANKGLAEQFEGRTVRKRYLALVERPPGAPAEATLVHDLRPDGDGRMVATVARPGSPAPKGSQRAVTRLKELRREGTRCLVALHPETGRTHQLRAQLAAVGTPIAGDPWYGGSPAPRLGLHAASLQLAHPLTQAPLTLEAPTPAFFDAWLRGLDDPRDLATRLRDAADRRWHLHADPEITAFRLAHFGDGLRDTVDVYDRWAVVSAYGEPDPALLDAVAAAGFSGVYLKARPKQANTLVETRREEVAPPRAVRGEDAPDPLPVREHGLQYLTRLGDGLSTGIFLDMRESRQRVRAMSQGLRVLNLFAYTGPFTVAAAAGGAARTVTVDVSASALDVCARNLSLNGLAGPQHSLVRADVFGYLHGARARNERFDLVLCDPPSFSTTRDSRWSATSDYARLAETLFALLAPGGRLLACTNHRAYPRMKFRRHLHEAARAAGRVVTQMKDMPAPEDFPPAPGEEPHLKAVLVSVK